MHVLHAYIVVLVVVMEGYVQSGVCTWRLGRDVGMRCEVTGCVCNLHLVLYSVL